VAVAWGQFRHPGMGTFAVGSQYQRPCEEQQEKQTLCVCVVNCGELCVQ
jgi:hypothetical protein